MSESAYIESESSDDELDSSENSTQFLANQPKLSAVHIREKLKSGEFKIIECDENSSSKSSCWKSFEKIAYSENNKLLGYVRCKKCKEFLRWASRNGTSHLKRHIDICIRNLPDQQQQSSLRAHFLTKNIKLSNETKTKVTDKCVMMCAKDLKPFETCGNEGFVDFCNTLIQIGAKFGIIDAKEVLPDPTTVSRKAVVLADECREKLKPILTEVFNSYGGAVTTDHWTDDFRKRSYFSATVHYVDAEWKLWDRTLCVTEFDQDLQKTGENIRHTVFHALNTFGIATSKIQANVVLVTDQGSNMLSAFRKFSHLSCSAHVLNTVLRNTFEKIKTIAKSGSEESEDAMKVTATIKACKKLVTHFKDTGSMKFLKHAIVQEVETRWNSKVNMLKSVISNWQDIEEYLASKDDIDRLLAIDKTVAENLVEMLSSFYDATLMLETSKQPTLPLVALWYQSLTDKLSKMKASEHPSYVVLVKTQLEKFLYAKFDINILHKAALCLCPTYSGLTMLPVFEKQETYAFIQSLLADKKTRTVAATDVEDVQPREKKAKSTTLLFSEYASTSRTNNGNDELAAYLQNETETIEMDKLLDWWKKAEVRYPNLSKVAKYVLSIPATSASSERSFSLAGNIINSLRSSIKPKKVNDLIFLKSNADLCR